MPTVTLGVATETDTARPVTHSHSVTLGVAVETEVPQRIRGYAAAPHGTLERLTAALYDATGQSLVRQLPHIDSQTYRDEVSQRGNANFRIWLSDATGLDFDSVVKFTWRGGIRFGCVIRGESGEYASDNRRWLSFQNQLGLLSLLDQATITPEFGLDRQSSSSRRFGFMSQEGSWYDQDAWTIPLAVRWADETGQRKGYPPELKASNPAWISAAPGPDVTVPAGTKNWFRYIFTADADYKLRLAFGADNFITIYWDGEQVLAPDYHTPWGYHTTTSVDVFAAAGEHRLAILVENAPAQYRGAFNACALIGTVFHLDNNGNPSGVYFVTNGEPGSHWRVTSVKPGWHKGYLIGEMLEEAQIRGVPGALALTPTFTDNYDSNGEPWSDVPDEYSFDIETTTLADMIIALCESGINAHVNAATMELDLYNRMGSDLYGTVEYKLGDTGGSLTKYQVDAVSARATSITAHIEDGTWEEVDDTAGIATYGRREVGYNLGTAPNADTARAMALAQLAESAAPQLQITTQAHILRGPQFYDDHDLGDSVKLPGRRNAGNLKGRALAVTVTQNGDKVEVAPEFMQDKT